MRITLSGVVIADGILQDNIHFERNGIHFHLSSLSNFCFHAKKKSISMLAWNLLLGLKHFVIRIHHVALFQACAGAMCVFCKHLGKELLT
jgi:hypothetical protein